MAVSCIAGVVRVGKSAFDRADHQAAPIATPQLDQIEAASLNLMRIRGIGGGAQFVGKRMRKAA